jgi:hypothetical protein
MIVVYQIIVIWYRKEPRVYAPLIYILKNLQNFEFELSQKIKKKLF